MMNLSKNTSTFRCSFLVSLLSLTNQFHQQFMQIPIVKTFQKQQNLEILSSLHFQILSHPLMLSISYLLHYHTDFLNHNF